MRLLVANDIGAWSELVKRYGKLVYSICFQVLKNNSDTEDAVQNTFVNLKLYAAKFDQDQPLKPWLARIASIEAIRVYKKKKINNKKESVRMESNSKSQRRDAAEIIEQKVIELMVRKAFDTLPDNTRVALTLYYAGGLNQTEIADQLGISQVRISLAIKTGLEKVKAFLKKAGVSAAIILSPNLLQEGITSAVPPQALMQKLITHLPTESQLAAASVGTQIAAKKSIAVWLLSLLSLPVMVFFSYTYWPKKSEEKITPVVQQPKAVISKNEKSFRPVEYNDYLPIYYKWGTMQLNTKPLSWKPGLLQYYGGDPNWTVIKNENGQTTIKRNTFEIGAIDGLFLKETFRQAYHFKGTIKLEAENGMFEFIAKTPYDVAVPVKINSVENEKLVTDSGSTLGVYKTQVNCEVDFQIFVWPEKNKWKSICIFENKLDGDQNSATSNWLNFTKQEISIGFYSKGHAEVNNFEYSPLSNQWDPLLEPYIKAVEKDLPKDFLPKH